MPELEPPSGALARSLVMDAVVQRRVAELLLNAFSLIEVAALREFAHAKSLDITYRTFVLQTETVRFRWPDEDSSKMHIEAVLRLSQLLGVCA